MPKSPGRKRVVVPTARQRQTFRDVSSFLGERGFVLFPLAPPFRCFEGSLALKKDTVMRLDPHPHAIVSELPDPLTVEMAPGGLVRVRPFKHHSLYRKLRSELRQRFGRRVAFGRQVSRRQKTPWHGYLSREHLHEWAALAGVTLKTQSRAA